MGSFRQETIKFGLVSRLIEDELGELETAVQRHATAERLVQRFGESKRLLIANRTVTVSNHKVWRAVYTFAERLCKRP